MVFGIAAVCSATVRYVSATGNDANDGLSWAAAKRTLQASVTSAGTGDEIWVQQGTYTALSNQPLAKVDSRMGIQIYGGFVGNETSRDQRNSTANNTILTGNGHTVLWLNNTYAIHSVQNNVDSTIVTPVVIDGFTITGGIGYLGGLPFPGIPPQCRSGGGIFITGECDGIVISNNIIKNNNLPLTSYGPNMPPYFPKMVSGYGGGIYSYYGGSHAARIDVCNNQILGNSAGQGGGLYIFNGVVHIYNNLVQGNSSTFAGGGLYLQGNSYDSRYTNHETHPELYSNTFRNNTVFCANTLPPDFVGGGAISIFSSCTWITRNLFEGNKASCTGAGWARGGAIYGGALRYLNNIFRENHASHGGGALYLAGSLSVVNTVSMIGNNTFVYNTADNGQGSSVYAGIRSSNGGYNAWLMSNIFYGDTVDTPNSWDVYAASNDSSSGDLGALVVVDYCDAPTGGFNDHFKASAPYGNSKDAIVEPHPGYSPIVDHNIYSDPQLVDALGGDYHLASSSLCIDAGSMNYPPSGLPPVYVWMLPEVSPDFYGNPRFTQYHQDGTPYIDIGAAQYTP